jgi:hypothetical protein
MSWIFGEPPTRGSRFVALYDDGSGAELFVWGDDGHLLDADGDDHGVMDREELDDWLYETGHWCWTALPEGYAVGFGVTTTTARDTRWCFAEMPSRGTRFVALRKDGRGAEVFSHTRLGSVMDAEGKLRLPMWATNAERVSWFEDAGFAFWLPLPDGMQLFYEGQS